MYPYLCLKSGGEMDMEDIQQWLYFEGILNAEAQGEAK